MSKLSPKEKLQKEIDSLLSKAFPEKTAEDTDMKKSNEAAFDENLDAKAASTDVTVNANGGEDVIKNKDEKDKKSEKMNKDGDKECDEDDKGDKKMKKSESAVEVSAEDFEILTKAKADIAEKAKKEAEANDPLLKSLNGLTDLIKSQQSSIEKLTTEVEQLKKSPVRERKALLKGVDAVEKGEDLNKSEAATNNNKVSKAQVLEVMFDLQKSGKLEDIHVCEYESTGGISDKMVKSMVRTALDEKFRK